jgi:hypothetical protein
LHRSKKDHFKTQNLDKRLEKRKKKTGPRTLEIPQKYPFVGKLFCKGEQ